MKRKRQRLTNHKPISVTGKEPYNLTNEEKNIIDLVLEKARYGTKSAFELRKINHDENISENPWQKARAKGENEIVSLEDMAKFYKNSKLSKALSMSPP